MQFHTDDLLAVSGRIFDIQRFSVHDGPGIRTIVFLKGCRLRCRWCCNPESQSYDIEEMHMPGKDKIAGRDVTVGEVLETVQKDRPYYLRSGGGMTLSGGEAAQQPAFASALFAAAKQAGLDTAIETAGFAPWENYDAMLDNIDHVLMDIKHMNPEIHKEYTGQDNALILENAKKIAARARDLTVRIPVIPGVNDSESAIRHISRFAATLPRVERLHLLPYHRLGQDKYAALGRTYSLPDVTPPTAEHMNALLAVAEESGLYCRIGG